MLLFEQSFIIFFKNFDLTVIEKKIILKMKNVNDQNFFNFVGV